MGAVTPEHASILTVEAQRFVATLHRCFNARREELLHRRVSRQYEIDGGKLPGVIYCFVAASTAVMLRSVYMCSRP